MVAVTAKGGGGSRGTNHGEIWEVCEDVPLAIRQRSKLPKAGIFLTFGVTLYALFEIMYQRGFDTDGRLVMSWY
jgi:hypothetical protein